MRSKLGYRIWQFWQSLQKPPQPEEYNIARDVLSSAELELFLKLPVPDMNHSLRVFHHLASEGETDPDLLKAALLHDIGKSCHPLRRWERVFGVLAVGLFPRRSAVWGQKDPGSIHRPLSVIQQHPAWGADLAEKAGCSQQVVWLIRYHEVDDLTGILEQGGVELLQKLQQADNLN